MEKSTTLIGRKLRLLRTQSNLRQADIAEILHVSRQSYQSYELGKHEPNLQTLNELAEFYEVPVEYLANNDLELDGLVREAPRYGRRKSDDAMLVELSHLMSYEEYMKFVEFGKSLIKKRLKGKHLQN
ncbi:MAG: helix-turn-helix transcriptional regulator [Lachnospiraceae bacterium]|nr:helix-turn-helix transcriptional regulator [Lachnospiraceae bacterium]MBP5183665.1 helix-turn-helix transcriptional regulator [Lachnospiraceae bacterium]